MAIAIEQSIPTADNAPDTSKTSTSWTPGSNELLLCLVAIRGSSTPSGHVSGVSGNGLTWTKILERDDTQNVISLVVYAAQGASPSAGGVTVTYGSFPLACSFQIIRLSGVDTSDAIGATATADTGATDTATPAATVTTTRSNSRVIGFGAGRNNTWTGGAGTDILIHQTAGAGGNVASSSSEYIDVASSATEQTMDFSISSAQDWVAAAIEILAASTVHALTATDLSTGAPVLGTPTAAHVHVLSAVSIVTAAPVMDTPVVAQVHVLVATGVTTGTPTVDTPTVAQVHVLAAVALTTDLPSLGTPTVTQVHILTAQDITTGAPVLGDPFVGTTGVDNVDAANLETGAPVLEAPTVAQIHALLSADLATGAPTLGNPFVGQAHSLAALSLMAGSPTLGTPTASDITRFPPDRIYVVESENRSYVIALENRTYELKTERTR